MGKTLRSLFMHNNYQLIKGPKGLCEREGTTKAGVTLKLSLKITPITGLPGFVFSLRALPLRANLVSRCSPVDYRG